MLDIATDVLYQKFKSDSSLAALLLSTGNAQIVNVHNNSVWGIGVDSEGNNFTGTAADLTGTWSE